MRVKRQKPKRVGKGSVLVALGVACAVALNVNAADGTWIGASDANWATEGNWSATPVPGTGESATFNGPGANTTVSLGSGVTVSNIVFDTAAAAAYTIGSGAVGSETLTLDDSGGVTVNSTVVNAQTFKSAITLGTAITATTTISNSSGSLVTFAGNITGGTGGTAGSKVLMFAGNGDFQVGSMSQGGASWFGANHAGAGTLNATGTLALISAAGAVPKIDALTMGGGTIDLGTTGALNITLSGSSVPNAINGSGTITGGTLSFWGANSIIKAPFGLLTIDSLVAGSPTILSLGSGGDAGTVVLNHAANTYSGQSYISGRHTIKVKSIKNVGTACSLGQPTTVADGTIIIGSGTVDGKLVYIGTGDVSDRVIYLGGSGVTLDQSGTGLLKFTSALTSGTTSKTLTLKGSTAGTGELAGAIINGSGGTVSFVKSGTGSWTLSGNNTFTGTTTLDAGTLKLNYDTGAGGTDSSKLADAAALNLNGATLELSGGTHPEVVASMTLLNSGTSFIKQTGGGSATLALGAITFTGGALDVGGAGIATTTTGNNAAGILSLRATLAGADYAINGGSGNIVAYSGYTPFAGTFAANTIYELLGNGSISGAPNVTSSGLKIAPTSSGQSLALGGNLSVGSILFTGSYDYAITASPNQYASASILNYGTGVLTVAGGYAANFYGTGKNIITGIAGSHQSRGIYGGTVQFSDRLQIAPDSAGASTTTLNNGTLLADTSAADIAFARGDGTSTRSFSIGEGGGTFDVIGGNDFTIPGVISGTGPVTFGSATSSGSIILTAAKTYTGPTFVNGGTLLVNGSTAAASAVTVNSGGTLGGTGTVSGAISVLAGGTLAAGGVDGLGTLTVGGDLTFAVGATNRVRIAGAAAGEYAVFSVAAGRQVDLGGATLLLDDTGFSGTGEIVIVTASGSGSISGTFGSVVGSTRGWVVSYPDSTRVVLTRASSGSVFRFY